MKIQQVLKKAAEALNNVQSRIAIAFSVALMSVGAHAFDFDSLVDNGQSAEDVAENADDIMKIAFNLMKGIAVVVGIVLVYQGIMRVKKANEPNSQTSPVTGIIFILLGGCLGALPLVFLTSASIIQG